MSRPESSWGCDSRATYDPPGLTPSVSELTRGLEDVLLTPRRGPGVCRVCFNLTDGYDRCWACAHAVRWLDVVAPISYSVSGGFLHEMLVVYKRERGLQAHAFGTRLAAVLGRYLVLHERCVATVAHVARFDLVTTVPSSNRERDAVHPLRRIVEQLTGPVSDRYRQVLWRSASPAEPHTFDAARFETREALGGRAVLLIDDTWTTGASAQSAAAALKMAGAGVVAAVVVGRYLTGSWRSNRERLRALPRPFRWEACALESGSDADGLAWRPCGGTTR
jgi:predicted amidophosphoribosyltransferase